MQYKQFVIDIPIDLFEKEMQNIRKIIEINQERCDGCGVCLTNCMESALAIVDGKAKVISDVLCDGLGACLKSCPQDALRIVERPALPFDVDAVRMLQDKAQTPPSNTGCPSLKEMQTSHKPWPLKLRIMPANSPFLKDVPLLFMADCAPACMTNFHTSHAHEVKLMTCPKFEDHDQILQKIIEILTENTPKNLHVLRMEVPCCHALQNITQAAITHLQENTQITPPRLKYEVCSRDGYILQDTLL